MFFDRNWISSSINTALVLFSPRSCLSPPSHSIFRCLITVCTTLRISVQQTKFPRAVLMAQIKFSRENAFDVTLNDIINSICLFIDDLNGTFYFAFKHLCKVDFELSRVLPFQLLSSDFFDENNFYVQSNVYDSVTRARLLIKYSGSHTWIQWKLHIIIGIKEGSSRK